MPNLPNANALEVIRSGTHVTEKKLAAITARHARVIMGPVALHRFANKW
jgi:hypothetical protein